jgi:hypothetical protein
MESRISSPARNRAEDRVLFIVIPLFVLDAILGIWGFHYHHLHPTGLFAYLCAFIATLPCFAYILVYGLYLAEEKDEFQHWLTVQSMLWGIGVTLSVTTFWGMLEKYDPTVSRMDISSVQFLFLCVAAVSLLVYRWRYR